MRVPAIRWPAALVVVAGLALTGPGLVAGHAEIVSSYPGDGASVPESPPNLTMTFTEAIDPITAFIEVLGENGLAVPGLGTLTVDAAGSTATVPLPVLPDGLYTVHYRVTSAVDGHVVEGTWAFLVDPTGTRPPPGLTAASSSPSSDPPALAARWLALLAGLAALGTVIFWLASARPALARLGVTLADDGIPWSALSVAGVAAALGLAAHLALAGGWSPVDFTSPFGSTGFAQAMRISLLAAVAWAGLAFNRRWLPAVGVAAALFLGGLAMAGHPASIGGGLFGLADWLHLVAVATWLGTLPGFFVVLRRLRGSESARDAMGAILRRHSRFALVAAPVVALTGIANSPFLLGSTRALVASDYGDLLLAKAFLFSIAVAIGSANFFLVRAASLRRTVPLIAAELAIGTFAVLAAAGLATAQPAAYRPPLLVRPAIGAAQLFGAVTETTVHVAVNLPTPGVQRYQVSVADAITGAYRTDVEQVSLVFRPPAGSGLADERVDLSHSLEPWLWGASGEYTPVAGDWRLGVVVKLNGQPEHSTILDFTVVPALPTEQIPPEQTGVDEPLPFALVRSILPSGAAGPGAVGIVALTGLALVWRARTTRRRWIGGAAAVVLAVAATGGLALGTRAVIEITNAPPASAAAATNPVSPDAASVARGRELYLANCSSCHGTAGLGDGPTAAGMWPPPGDLRTLVPGLSDGTLAYRTSLGKVGTRMPSFAGTLTEADRWDLVNYLRAAFPEAR